MPNRVSIVKNLLEQSVEIVVGFEIFEIDRKTKKLSLQNISKGFPRRYTLAAQGSLEVPSGAQKGQPGQKVLGAFNRNNSRL